MEIFRKIADMAHPQINNFHLKKITKLFCVLNIYISTLNICLATLLQNLSVSCKLCLKAHIFSNLVL